MTEIDPKPYLKDWDSNAMRRPKVEKVVVNFAVGSSGPTLEKARTLCESLTDQVPTESRAKNSVRSFNIRKGEPIGIRVTLRGEKAKSFLARALWARDDTVTPKNFDKNGNLYFGIPDHLELEGIRYDPSIGVHGFDVAAVIERPGYRIKRRRRQRTKIPGRHRISQEEGMAFFMEEFGIKVEEEVQEDYY